VSPNEREREYQRRRYEEWQKKLDAKKTQKAQRNRMVAAVAAAVGVVAVALGVVWLASGDDTETPPAAAPAASASPTASPSPSGSASPSPSQSPSAAASPTAKSECPPSTAKTPGTAAKSWPTPPPVGDTAEHTYTLKLATSCGDITAKLDGSKAPKAVSSTVFLAQQGFYDDTPCHRLTTDGIYVLQCGDPTGTGGGGAGYTYGPVENAPTEQMYPAGTIAMARAQEETSQSSQFFIVYKDSPIPGNYTVLGQVTDGLDVVKKIASGGSQAPNAQGNTAPNWPISVKTATAKQD
jgi:peptidyl-prolyl cis-trans isomerase B (cyclophilin B)